MSSFVKLAIAFFLGGSITVLSFFLWSKVSPGGDADGFFAISFAAFFVMLLEAYIGYRVPRRSKITLLVSSLVFLTATAVLLSLVL